MANYLGCDIPEDLYFHPEYDSWVRFEEDGVAVMGMTDLAQTLAGKLLFIRMKKVGKVVKGGKIAATIESGKWIGPFIMPVEAEILENNEQAYKDDILIANKDPYGAGWLFKVRFADPEAAKKVLVTGEEAYAVLKDKIDEHGVHCFRCID